MVHKHSSYFNAANPRLPPFPHVTRLQPFLQIKQAFASITKWRAALSQWQSSAGSSTPVNQEAALPLPLIACFAHARARLAGQTPNTSYARERERGKSSPLRLPPLSLSSSDRCPPSAESKPPLDALFVLSCEGRLVEYMLDVRPRRPLSGSAGTTGGGGAALYPQQWNGYPKDGPVELVQAPRAQWVLSRSRAVAIATASNNGRNVIVPIPPLLSSHPLLIAAECAQPRRGCSFGASLSPNSSGLACGERKPCGGTTA